MPEETTSTSANAQAANVDPPAQAAIVPNAQAATDSEQITFEEARRLRSESVNLRKRLKSYEDAEEAAKTAALSEVEKANKRSADLEKKVQEYQKQLIAAQVKIAAQAKGIIDPDLAALAVEKQLEFGEDGMPSNLDKALDELVKAKPYLISKPAEQQTTPATTASTTNPPATPAMNPGRTNIASPTQLPPGKRPKLSELL